MSVATAILHSNRLPDGSLALTLADTKGQQQRLTIAAELLSALAQVFKSAVKTADEMLTKLPHNFAVGSGKYENLVLVRFEDEPAYAMPPEQAVELGEALIECAEELSERRAMLYS